MRKCLVSALMFALLFAAPALAQEQRGTIEGVVKDSTGAVLAGASVEAKSAAGLNLTTTSDEIGVYRFPAVPPGLYEVTAKKAGFAPGKVSDVLVAVGQIKKIDLALSVGAITEQVKVTAESPLVDVRSSTRSFDIRDVDKLPGGRDFLTLVTRAPGANFEPKSNGVMVDGATASENRYVIDGVETTDIVHGTSGKALITDFIQEVQVKSSGYTAEYGGSTGGVINVITKSGTNQYQGSALFNWQGSSLAGKTPSLRLDLNTGLTGEYVTYPKDTTNRYEPGFTFGGPAIRDKQWFWAAFQPALTSLERTASPDTAKNPKGTTITRTQKQQVQYLSANHTAQIGERLRTRVAFNNSWSKVDGLLPSLSATDPLDSASVNYLPVSVFPSWTISGNADYTVSPKLVVGVRAGYFLTDHHDSNAPDVSRYAFSTSNVGFVGTNGVPVPANLQHPAGFTSVLSFFATQKDKLARTNFDVYATWFGRFAGQHQIKGGVQIDRRANDVYLGELQHRVTIRWGSSLGGQRGPFGYYSIRSAVDTRVDPGRYGGADQANKLKKNGFTTIGNVNSNLTGFFIQDAWEIGRRLTVNLGLRTENEEVPIFGVVPGIDVTPIQFGWGDKLAPRVGFAYDLKGDGRTKVYGSWGIFYDIFKYELPRGSYGGDKWTEYYFTLDTPDFTTLNTGAACPPTCSGSPILSGGRPRIVDFRLPTYSLKPDDCYLQGCTETNLKPMKSQEFSVGFEHQIGRLLAGSVRYVHKQIDRGIEDIGTLDPDGNEAYIIGNPGEGVASAFYPSDGGSAIPLPKPKRDYDGVEFTLDKRFANNYFVRASYLWSRLVGNYPGLSQTDENGRADPNVGRLYDFQIMMFQANGKPVDGPLPTDRPHQFKAQFLYQMPFGMGIGINQFVSSGIPMTAEVGVLAPNNYPMQWKNRGSDGRTPVLSQTDLLVQHSFKLAGGRSVQVNFNVLNLFNQETVINKFITFQRVNGISFPESTLYKGQLNIDALLAALEADTSNGKDPRFLMANGFQAPIQARFGVKLIF